MGAGSSSEVRERFFVAILTRAVQKSNDLLCGWTTISASGKLQEGLCNFLHELLNRVLEAQIALEMRNRVRAVVLGERCVHGTGLEQPLNCLGRLLKVFDLITQFLQKFNARRPTYIELFDTRAFPRCYKSVSTRGVCGNSPPPPTLARCRTISSRYC